MQKNLKMKSFQGTMNPSYFTRSQYFHDQQAQHLVSQSPVTGQKYLYYS